MLVLAKSNAIPVASVGRKAALLPMFEDMKAWLEEVVKQAKEAGAEIENKTSIAINYFLDRYDELTRFLDYYCANSNNNRALCAVNNNARLKQKLLTAKELLYIAA